MCEGITMLNNLADILANSTLLSEYPGMKSVSFFHNNFFEYYCINHLSGSERTVCLTKTQQQCETLPLVAVEYYSALIFEYLTKNLE